MYAVFSTIRLRPF